MTVPEWMAGLPTDDIAYLQNRGLHQEGRGIPDLVKSLRHAQSVIGGDASKVVPLPDWAKPEEVQVFRDRMGVPKDASGYETPEITTSAGVLEGGPIAAMSWELGHTPEQHVKLVELAGSLIDTTHNEQTAAQSASNGAEMVEVTKEHAADAKEWKATLTKGRKALMLTDAEDLAITNVLGPRRTLQILEELGAVQAEHTPPNNEGGGGFEGVMSQDVALARKAQLMKSKSFRKKMFEDNDPDAIKQWNDVVIAAAGPD